MLKKIISIRRVAIFSLSSIIIFSLSIFSAYSQQMPNMNDDSAIVKKSLMNDDEEIAHPFFTHMGMPEAVGTYSLRTSALLTKNMDGKTTTNHAGGIVGGISNGNELIFRIAIKPTSSTPIEQQTLNIETDTVESFSVKGRHDLCIALRVPVILEAVTAFVLADLMLLEQKIPRIIH